jgi:DNA-binding transcriptional LysR family regulator
LREPSAKLHIDGVFAWDDLKHFLAFARTGSMLAAAKTLGVNQSTVQRRLAELESRLGHRLIERHLGGYRLSRLGEELRPLAERVEEAAAAVERHLAACDKDLTGTIRVTCPTTFGERFAGSALIDAFHARFPGLRVELLMSDRFLDLAKGEAEIAIRSSSPHDDSLIGRKIAESPWAVYASRSYVERHGQPTRVEDIERHFVVACDGAIAHYPAGRWLRSVAPHATVATRSDTWPGFVAAVKSGAGLAAMPVFQGDRESALVRVIDHIPDLVTPWYLLMHADMQHTPRVRAFFDFVVTEIKAFRALLSGKTPRGELGGQS